MRVPISTAWDPIAGTSVHLALIPPQPTPVASPSLEIPSTHLTSTGYALGRANVATTVCFLGRVYVVQKGNDTGPGLGDVTISNPANPLLPAIMAGSKRKMVFGAPRVQLEGEDAGAHAVGWPACPILTCGHPTSLPTVGGPLNLCYPVTIGITPTELQAGWAEVLVTIVVDLLIDHFFPKTADASFSEAWIRAEAVKNLVGQHTARTLGVDAIRNLLVGVSAAVAEREEFSVGFTVGGAGVAFKSTLTLDSHGVSASQTVETAGQERVRLEVDEDSGIELSPGPSAPEGFAEALSELEESLFPRIPSAWL